MEIRISGKNKELLQRVTNLAVKLGLKVHISAGNETINQVNSNNYDASKAIEAIEKLSRLKTFEEIKDPVSWQCQVREDRNLF